MFWDINHAPAQMSPIFSDALLKCLCYKLKFILTKANIIFSSPSGSPSSLAPLPAISNDITINEINIVELFFQQNTFAVNREWDSSLSSSWPRHEILCMHCCLYSATRKKIRKFCASVTEERLSVSVYDCIQFFPRNRRNVGCCIYFLCKERSTKSLNYVLLVWFKVQLLQQQHLQ